MTPWPHTPQAFRFRCMGLRGGDQEDNFTTNPEEQRDAQILKDSIANPQAPLKIGQSLDDYASVEISKSGRFKYVLVQAKDSKGRVKHFVRGDIEHDYHVYCAKPLVDKLKDSGFETKVLGGGRMEHLPNQKILQIFGYSHSFGMEDKSITKDVCLRKFPGYYIETSESGY
mmetsp:Transcript_21244/g.33266  ORF Transcript_21244/g.33266 Transcript_21244/m.33266 type:complete len:171 (+) Transcript_21244:188-700(+)|eukprot:CAMPEP_0184304552 /NCGR_PEP_ID=MMETSP1049-20130417/14035_1 /TAXON_ID=77928 /ORGANISM="Proteomonas sulcata, Strain CCMP704" /LENGTH=170 /DNA_ID=CAMNT_0026616377 /DNA_START=180 /DNA_END=692 /DNA_ORIENTATION=+